MVETFLDGGRPITGLPVIIKLVSAVDGHVGAGYSPAGTIIDQIPLTTDHHGRISVALTPNAEITVPAGTVYSITTAIERSVLTRGFTVPVSNAVETISAHLTDLPTSLPGPTISRSEKGAPGGVAPLDVDGFVAETYIPPGITRDAELTAAFTAFVAGAPTALNEWLELVAAIQADQTGLAGLATTVAAKVDKAGSTMTGPLTLPSNPGAALHAAPKQYVDAETTRATAAEVTNATAITAETNRAATAEAANATAITAETTRATGAENANATAIAANSVAIGAEAASRASGDAALVPKAGTYATSATSVAAARVTADTADRFTIDAGGRHQWGPGNAAADLTIYRSSAGALRVDGQVGVNIDAGTSLGNAAKPAGAGGGTLPLKAQLVISPSTDDMAGIVVKAPSTTWAAGNHANYGTDPFAILADDSAGTDILGGTMRFHISRYGDDGRTGWVHVFTGGNGAYPAGVTLPSQAMWIQPQIDVAGLVITQPAAGTKNLLLVTNNAGTTNRLVLDAAGNLTAGAAIGANAGLTTAVSLGVVTGSSPGIAFGSFGDALWYKKAGNQLAGNADLIARDGNVTQVIVGSYGGAAALQFGSASDAVLLRTAASELSTNKLIAISAGSTQVPLVARLPGSGTPNAIEVQTSASAIVARVTNGGDVVARHGASNQAILGDFFSLAGVSFGSAADAYLYRSAAAQLTTADLITGNQTFTDAKNMAFGTTTGTKIGTATTQKIGFFNKTPVVQPSGTPAAATDLATAVTLVNALRTSLLNLGLVA